MCVCISGNTTEVQVCARGTGDIACVCPRDEGSAKVTAMPLHSPFLAIDPSDSSDTLLVLY